MEPWMCVSLKPPPVLTTKLNKNTDVLDLKHVCDNITRMLSKQLPLHREGALLSRFIYKYDKKFRHDIGYRNVRKTYSSLRKYLELNLLKDVEHFTSVLPDAEDDFVPTKQMLEYLMCRILSFSKLMLRIYVSSKQGAVFYLDRIKRAQNHWMSLMPYALLSRVWSVCNVLLHHSTGWYSSLQPYLAEFQPKGIQFLPEGYNLPKNLYDWLELKQIDSFGKMNWAEKNSTNFDLTWADETQLTNSFDNILEFANNINAEVEADLQDKILQQIKVKEVPMVQQFQTSIAMEIDYGEVISRDSYKASQQQQNVLLHPEKIDRKSVVKNSRNILSNFQKKMTNDNKSSHYFGKVTNVKTLQDFLEKEESYRNDGNNQALTKHLSFMQWHTLKTALLKMGEKALNNKKIERKLSKVWKEKCLDYM